MNSSTVEMRVAGAQLAPTGAEVLKVDTSISLEAERSVAKKLLESVELIRPDAGAQTKT